MARTPGGVEVGGGPPVNVPQRMVAIAWRSGGVSADGAVGVALSADARVQQVDAHQVLGIGDGLAPAARLALAVEAVWNAPGLELAQFLGVRVLRGRVVKAIRVES